MDCSGLNITAEFDTNNSTNYNNTITDGPRFEALTGANSTMSEVEEEDGSQNSTSLFDESDGHHNSTDEGFDLENINEPVRTNFVNY